MTVNNDILRAVEAANQRFEEREAMKQLIAIPQFNVVSEEDRAKKEWEIECLKNFIIRINSNISIIKIQEKPDFELSYNGKSIGAELTSIATFNTRLDYIDKLFSNVQTKIRDAFPQYKFLVNCYFNRDLVVTRGTIELQSEELYNIFLPILSNGVECLKRYEFDDNPYLENISFQPHSMQICLSANSGADYCYDITTEQVNCLIRSKNKKIAEYDKTYGENWLLIDVPIAPKRGNQSLPDDIATLTDNLADSNFDKIYLYNFGEFHCLK